MSDDTLNIVEIRDERDPRARDALKLVLEMFAPADRQSTSALLSEIAESRLNLLEGDGFHLITALSEDGRPMGTIVGVYLRAVNAGFILYLAVRPEYRGKELARTLRRALATAFRADARNNGQDELAWVLGEVKAESAWLRRLVRERKVIPFDLTYYHPGMSPGGGDDVYILYRDPIGDPRPELPAQLVRQIIYDIFRRGYRVSYPLVHAGFAAMIAELEGRDVVGPHPRMEEWGVD
jgi:GNAT superfamily N-acetyltransferase